MEHDNKEKVRPVSVDGIQEFDNQLPSWWVGLFYLTIVIGAAYGVYKYLLGGESLIQAYNQEMADATRSLEAPTGGSGGGVSAPAEVSSVPLADRVKDPATIAAGKEVFSGYCTPCHGQDGGGVIGPNLTDHYFLHGNTPEEIVKVISSGVVDKGMAAWLPTLGQAKVEQVAAYALSLIGTTPQAPKAPQGDLKQ